LIFQKVTILLLFFFSFTCQHLPAIFSIFNLFLQFLRFQRRNSELDSNKISSFSNFFSFFRTFSSNFLNFFFRNNFFFSIRKKTPTKPGTKIPSLQRIVSDPKKWPKKLPKRGPKWPKIGPNICFLCIFYFPELQKFPNFSKKIKIGKTKELFSDFFLIFLYK